MTKKSKITELYDSLIDACNKSESLHYHDEITAMQKYVRIFNYDKHADPKIWKLKNSIEFKGITFEMDGEKPVSVLCRPMIKIFDMTSKIKPSDISYITEKIDGTLVSSYIDNGYPSLKTEESLYSDIALLACSLLNTEPYRALREHITNNKGFTYNFEYIAPDNHIVLNYTQQKLNLLNVRNNETGETISVKQLFNDPVLRPYVINWIDMTPEHFNDVLRQLNTAELIEGIVGVTKSGEMFKVKCDWYNQVYQLKDCVLHPDHLIYYVSEDETDDLKNAFLNQQKELDRIEIFEDAYREILDETISVVSEFYSKNAGIDKNTYSANAMKTARKDGIYKDYIYKSLMIVYTGLDYDKVIDYLKSYYVGNYSKLIPTDKIEW